MKIVLTLVRSKSSDAFALYHVLHICNIFCLGPSGSSTWTFVFDRLARGWLWHISSSRKTWNVSWHNGKIYFMQRSRKSITFPPKWTGVVKLSRPQSSKGLHILFQWMTMGLGYKKRGDGKKGVLNCRKTIFLKDMVKYFSFSKTKIGREINVWNPPQKISPCLCHWMMLHIEKGYMYIPCTRCSTVVTDLFQ